MVVHDYPVKKLSIEDLERRASDLRAKCGLASDAPISVLKLLFEDMPQYLQKQGLTLVLRAAGHMGDREAYAAPKAKRIFYRSSLLARLKFGDIQASLIFLHELAHFLLHRDNGGAEKAWLREENKKVSFVSKEESAEWQATMFALCLKAPASAAMTMTSADELAKKFGLDSEHSTQRFETLQRRLPRKIPDIYQKVRGELNGFENVHAMGKPYEQASVASLCPDCGLGKLADLDGKQYCDRCKTFGSKLQDGDTLGLDPAF